MDQDRGYIKTNKCFEESTSHLVNIFILPIAEERLQLKSMARKFSKKNDIIIHWTGRFILCLWLLPAC